MTEESTQASRGVRLDQELSEPTHADQLALFWIDVGESVPAALRPWLVQSLAHAWRGEQIVGLLAVENSHLRRWFWCVAQMQIQLDDSSGAFEAVRQFFARLAGLDPLPALGAPAVPRRRTLWELHLRDGGLLRAGMGTPPSSLVGLRCAYPACAGAPAVRGCLANHQRSEQTELEAARGRWLATRPDEIAAQRYYCTEHDCCDAARGLAPQPCRGPLWMITTRLLSGGSACELDGGLFCHAHAPHGPRHLVMIKKRPT